MRLPVTINLELFSEKESKEQGYFEWPFFAYIIYEK